MSLYEKIISIYPDLTPSDFGAFGSIVLRNDLDERGDYIEAWAHPVYAKPTDEQLAAIN